MRSWSVDTKHLKKNKRQYSIWRLESLINFGLGKEKIRERELRDNIKHLNIDKGKVNFLKLILSEK